MGPIDPTRLKEHVHGHLGWLAALALAHPAILLRRIHCRAHWAVGLSAGIVTLAAALGAATYPAYRETLRQPIFAGARAIGYLFERKEHLAFGAVGLSWVGAVAYAVAPRADPVTRELLRRAAHRSFVAAALFGAAAAILGTLVAAYRTF
ncbi:MAG: hypothetical protein JOZ69_03020 [Myxococcales bacterium]|nr:hypothetical protein [Myxococcales bacterium]